MTICISRYEPPPSVVVYDWNPDNGNGRMAVDRFAARTDHPCVLLASKVIDDYLLAEFVRRGGAHFARQHSNPFRAGGSSGIIRGVTSGGRPFSA